MQNLNTIRDWLRWLTSEFNRHQLFFGHGTDNAFDEALALLVHGLHLEHSIMDHLLDAHLTTAEKQKIQQLAQQRIEQRKPLPYITGEAYFAGLKFKVNEQVLIPRSPMAELIEKQLQPWLVQPADHSLRILDLCTGSGCIAIALAVYLPDAQIDGVDISSEALNIAAENAAYHGVDERIRWIESDLFSALPPQQQYDVIISNPPYVTTAEMQALPPEYQHEPQLALEAGEDGMDLVVRILQQARYYLQPNGFIMVEVGYSQEQLEQRCPQIPFQWLSFERGGEGVFLLDYQQLKEECDDIKTS